jgi:hypothetical protein
MRQPVDGRVLVPRDVIVERDVLSLAPANGPWSSSWLHSDSIARSLAAVQRVLDIDLDFFVTPVVHWPSDTDRRDASKPRSVDG